VHLRNEVVESRDHPTPESLTMQARGLRLTMGTMVGDDGDPGDNQIGVAPHARWIAANACETFTCSISGLLASGEWIIAPTDLSGQNPRPDLAPTS
jgi:hypothetical protein